MKLKKILVNKLFGVFTHEIHLNNEERITIIIGENGLGKTVILEMVDAFFNGKYIYFKNVEFESVFFEFDDNVQWKLYKDETKDINPILKLTQINKNKSTYNPITLYDFKSKDMGILAQRIARENRKIKTFDTWIYEDKKITERLNQADIVSWYNYFNDHIYPINEEVPKWFKERHEEIKISLIETQRLIAFEEREEKNHKRTVEKYSLELSKTIKAYLTESTELSSKLDRTYPNRLVSRIKESSDLTDEHLNKELKGLEKKRELLDRVGLIEIEKDSNILEIENPQDVIRDVLMLYVEDSFKKIEIFDNIASKIEIFLDIINRRFKHKQLHIDKEEGFLFKSNKIFDKDGKPQRIPVTKLSSGEQNELVLFYLLLFKTDENSLILIDEPEVSLHISWQNCFIEDLKQITRLNNLDVIIATHSPDIISNNWKLKVELKGLE